MFSGRLTHAAFRLLDRFPGKHEATPPHLRTGRRGEQDAYFYLRRKGYVMVARNYRTARHHGEIDLIGWHKDVLCFIEVKTRTTHDVKPAEAAVDRKKRHDLRVVIRDYLRTLPRRQFPEPPPWRFDVITVYYETQRHAKPTDRNSATDGSSATLCKHSTSRRNAIRPTFELFQNAALSA